MSLWNYITPEYISLDTEIINSKINLQVQKNIQSIILCLQMGWQLIKIKKKLLQVCWIADTSNHSTQWYALKQNTCFAIR